MRLLSEEGFVPFKTIIKDFENITKEYSKLSIVNKLRIKLNLTTLNVKPRKKRRVMPKTERKDTHGFDEPLKEMKLPWH